MNYTTLALKIDNTRLKVSPTLDTKRRAELGQFMTPKVVAEQMASMFSSMPNKVKLLDAGAGIGALTVAFVIEAIKRGERPASIDVTAYEIEDKLISILEENLLACEAMCQKAGVKFTFRIIQDDYILRSADYPLGTPSNFNCAILNPPYGKIRSSSKWRRSLRKLGIETVNLYSAFLAIAIQQMAKNGEIVAITPRSFCNGVYYEPFRRLLLEFTAILSIHIFESRRTAFKDDNVLQENIVFKIQKGVKQNGVNLSGDNFAVKNVIFSDIVQPKDKHAFIRLPTNAKNLAARIESLPCRLKDLGISVSTGRVVDFRVKEHLRKMPDNSTVPLVYPAHLKNGVVTGPIVEFKKYNALSDNENTASLILPEGIYILTKRFTSKEEKRRIVAAIYNGERAGFENHLNYFHCNGKGLSEKLAKGLCAFLNSSLVDEYFRIFSGHTQVNATDLRNMHYPTIQQLGELADSKDIDTAVASLLQPSTLKCFAGSA